MESTADDRRSLSILLVEDEKASLELLANIISKKYPGGALYTAISGRKGLELYDTHTPDIVITDINMPDMNGLEMIQNIRAINPQIKSIVLTGDTGNLLLEAPIEAGLEVAHCIMKPIAFDKLFSAIEQCFDEILNTDC
jgi:YesN/AraC family two-component response regulator